MLEVISIFTFIFLAALPGRTTFLLIVLAASGNAKRIFIGAALAFLIQCLFSVVIGEVLVFVPQSYVEIIAGLLFIYFSIQLWSESNKSHEVTVTPKVHSIKSIFVLVFAAEFGDVSQLAIVASTTRASSKTMVFFISVFALWIITGLALILGSKLGRFIKPAVLQKFASVLFFTLGLYLSFKGIIQLSAIFL